MEKGSVLFLVVSAGALISLRGYVGGLLVALVCVAGVCCLELRAWSRRVAEGELRWSARKRRYMLSEHGGFLPAVFPVQDARLRHYVELGARVQRLQYVPQEIAEPWIAVCRELELPAGAVCACGLDLWAWTDNSFRSRLTGGTPTEIAFHRLAAEIHRRSAGDLRRILDVVDDAQAGRTRSVEVTLEKIVILLKDCKKLFSVGLKDVDPNVFYEELRPLLAGSSADSSRTFCTGNDGDTTIFSSGPSAAQSTLFLILDSILQAPTTETFANGASSFRSFQREMLAYMPAPHRALAVNFERTAHVVRNYIERVARLRNARQRARQALASFRAFHMKVATNYLRPTTETGTAGSDFRALLKEGIDATAARSQH